jgi:hypothetical protein
MRIDAIARRTFRGRPSSTKKAADKPARATTHASKGNLFPSPSHPDKHLSNVAMLMVLDRMGYGHVTVYGFRSTFKDWTRDRTRFARSTALDKRRKLMNAWAEFCASSPTGGDVVVPSRKRRPSPVPSA